MEFPFDCDAALNSDSEGFAFIKSSILKKLLPAGQANKIIDKLGTYSAKVFL